MLFISHANPEDNEFTLWLALQLAKDGYPVWCDLTQLLGGERFWQNAEEAIRTRTVKFLYVLSRVSNHKQGPRDELQIAFNVARDESLNDFVIPLHIDDLPHREINVQLSSITAIGFEKKWATGYHQLLQVLERAGVSKNANFHPSAVTSWWREQFSASRGVRAQQNIYTSNWLPISSLPPCLHLHSLVRSSTGLMELSAPAPHPAFMDGIDLVTFARAQDFEGKLHDFSIASTRCFKLDDILGDSDDLAVATRGIARRWLIRLLSDAWNRWVCTLTGLGRYEMSHGECHFFKKPVGNDSLSLGFVGLDGKQHRPRGVVGYKSRADKSKRYWHFGIQAKPMFHPQLLFSISSHVIFTDDGQKPWESAERMHKARRRQCKNWQNDEWRDKLLATLQWLSNGQAVIHIPVGHDLSVQLCARPLEFNSPLRYDDPPKKGQLTFANVEDSSVDHEQDDELSDDEYREDEE